MRIVSRLDRFPPPLNRREMMAAGAALLAVGPVGCCAARAAHPGSVPVRQLGAITGNSPQDMERFSHWLGRPQDHDLLYFNQESWAKLEQSVPFIVSTGAAVLAKRRKVHWSIPAGGSRAYAGIAAGQHDDLYRDIARCIDGLYGSSAERVCVRLFWEFNLPEQTLAARGADGTWEPALYVAAYRRVASILRMVSDRFYFDWCPNIGEGGVTPDRCYPGDDLVDVVSVDLYYRGAFDRQDHQDGGRAIFEYRRTQRFGLAWLADFASRKGKLVGISEWGVDDDQAVAFMEHMSAWIVGLGDLLSHHNYWDRNDGGVVSRLSTGELPHIGKLYRQTFGAISSG